MAQPKSERVLIPLTTSGRYSPRPMRSLLDASHFHNWEAACTDSVIFLAGIPLESPFRDEIHAHDQIPRSPLFSC